MYKFKLIIAVIIIFTLSIGCNIKKIQTTDDGIEVDGKIASVTTDAGFEAALARTDLEVINLAAGSFDGSYSVNSAVAINGSSGTSINGLTIGKTGVELSGFSANTVEIGSAVGDGDCKIQNIAISDQLIINGGGANSINITGSTKINGVMKVNKPGVSVKLTALVKIVDAVLSSNCAIVQTDTTADITSDNITNIFINVASSTATNMTINVMTANVNILQLPSTVSLDISSTVGFVTAMTENVVNLNISGSVEFLGAANAELVAVTGTGSVTPSQLSSLNYEIVADAASLLFDKLSKFSEMNSLKISSTGAFTISNEYDYIHLPTSFNYLNNMINISWTSSNSSVLSVQGEVNHTNSTETVILTANISIYEETNDIPLVFYVTVSPAATTTTTVVTSTTIPPDIEILGTWNISNLDPITGGEGTSAASFTISNANLEITYNGTVVLISGTIVSYDNSRKYAVYKTNAFEYNGQTISNMYMKTSWVVDIDGRISLTTYSPNIFQIGAINSTSVVWGPTPYWTKK